MTLLFIARVVPKTGESQKVLDVYYARRFAGIIVTRRGTVSRSN